MDACSATQSADSSVSACHRDEDSDEEENTAKRVKFSTERVFVPPSKPKILLETYCDRKPKSVEKRRPELLL